MMMENMKVITKTADKKRKNRKEMNNNQKNIKKKEKDFGFG